MSSRFYDKFIDSRKKGRIALENNQDEKAIDLFLEAAYYGIKSTQYLSGELIEERLKSCRRLKKFAVELMQNSNISNNTAEKVGGKHKKSPSNDSGKWVLKDRPNVNLDDVAGMYEVKELIQTKIIQPFKHRDIWAKYKLKLGGGVLMYGPPGNGKTFIASAIASELNAAFFSVKLSTVMSKWVGDTEKHLTELFTEAKSYPRSVVFLDEIEALLSKRGSGSTVMDRAVPQFLAEVDGIEPRTNCLFLLGATNKPWMIDDAALRPGRFGSLIYVGLPDFNARKKIMETNMDGVPLEKNLDLKKYARQLEGYSCADVAEICTEAREHAANRETNLRKSGYIDKTVAVSMDDLDQVIKKRKPSVKKKELLKYKKFMNET